MNSLRITIVVLLCVVLVSIIAAIVAAVYAPSPAQPRHVPASEEVVLSYSKFKDIYVPPDDADMHIPHLMMRTSHNAYTSMIEPLYNVISATRQLHPSYTFVYFDDDDCVSFIKEFYPDYLPGYLSLVPGAYRADVFRLMFLLRYGGIYNDCSHMYHASCDDIIDYKKDSLVLVNDRRDEGIYNAFMASTAQHPVIRRMLDDCMAMIRNREYGSGCLDITGPNACMRSFNKYYRLPLHHRLRGMRFLEDPSVRILYHTSKPFDLHTSYIVDDSHRIIITTKFPNYYTLMYNKENKPRYYDLWNKRQVYTYN